MIATPAGPSVMGGVVRQRIARQGRSPHVLCFHGFSSTPQEVELIVETAGALGLASSCELLPGHGGSLQELAASRWRDWRAAAEAQLTEATANGQPVIVAGMSTGALLALDLAADHPQQVAAVICCAPALRLAWPFPSLAMKLYCGLGLPDFFLPKKMGPDLRDPVQRRSHVTSTAQPAYAGNEVRLAGIRLRKRLGQIRCPAFIAHGKFDHVAPLRAGRETYQLLGTPQSKKHFVELPRSYHIITRDLDRELLRSELQAFLRSLPETRPAAAEPAQPASLVAQ